MANSFNEVDGTDGCINFGFFVYNYSRFHHNYWNRVIHFVFVPLIAMGVAGTVATTCFYFEFDDVMPIPFAELLFENPKHLSVHWVVLTAWSLLYVVVDPIIGFIQFVLWA